MKAAGLTTEAKAKSVIQLWMAGGPTQTDTFDPKAQAGEDYSGPAAPADRHQCRGHSDQANCCRCSRNRPTSTPSSAASRTATTATRRRRTSMQTCTMPAAELVYPAMGAVVAFKKSEQGYAGKLPPYVTLTNPLGRFSEAGFLGNNYKRSPRAAILIHRISRVQGIVPPKGDDAGPHGRAPQPAQSGRHFSRKRPKSSPRSKSWTNSRRKRIA